MAHRFAVCAPVAAILSLAILCGGCASLSATLNRVAAFAAVENEAADDATEAAAPVLVTVRAGDTLGRIAKIHYGDSDRASEIAADNELANPDLIFPGQVLLLSSARLPRRATPATYADSTPSPYDLLSRRAFTPPTHRQSDIGLIRASATDPFDGW